MRVALYTKDRAQRHSYVRYGAGPLAFSDP
jgi:hypothetical protein